MQQTCVDVIFSLKKTHKFVNALSSLCSTHVCFLWWLDESLDLRCFWPASLPPPPGADGFRDWKAT